MIKKAFIVIFTIFFFQNIQAEEKIAVVDIDYLINNSKAGKYIQTNIKKINDKNIKKFKDKEKEFEQNQSELATQKNILSEEEFNKKVINLRKEINEYNKSKRKIISDTNKKRSKAISELLAKINQLLIEHADKEKVSFIIDKKNIILTKNDNDITKEIFEILNKKHDKIKID